MHPDKDFFSQWENIIAAVDKTDIPLECINKIVLKLSGKKQKTINLIKLRKQGADFEDIEEVFKTYLGEYQDLIQDIDFVLDIETVASMIQPETDKLLNGL
jgi:hypothetical protein